MKRMILLCILVSPMISQAQVSPVNVPTVPVFLQDIDGRPLKLKNFEEVEGSPYLYEEWRHGSVRFAQGSVLSGVELKFVLYGGQLLFRKGNEEFEFIQPVQEFTLNMPGAVGGRIFRSYYPGVGTNDGKTFYEVMVDGKIQLLKFISRQVKEHKEYNEPVKKRFVDKESWYTFLPNGSIHAINRDKSDLQKLMPAKSELIERIIAEKKLKLRKDDDLVELFVALNKE